MRESKFQSNFIKRLRNLFPGCVILKVDRGYLQGIPDRFILFNDMWAAFEFKDEEYAEHQPNQDYYIDKLNGMSFAAFVYPENEEEVINELQQTFGRTHRIARVSLRK